MTVYLLHFDKPICETRTTQHYIGFTENDSVADRLITHIKGNGARLVQVANERNIDFILAKVWPEADRDYERHLKAKKNAPRFCPICKEKRRYYKKHELVDELLKDTPKGSKEYELLSRANILYFEMTLFKSNTKPYRQRLSQGNKYFNEAMKLRAQR